MKYKRIKGIKKKRTTNKQHNKNNLIKNQTEETRFKKKEKK
jgi:hypothetical protein